MMRCAVFLLGLLLAGCAHTSVQLNSGGGTTTAGASVSAGYSGHASAAAWALIGIGLIASQYSDSRREPAAEIDASRQVNEVDCTKPIENWSANLKCR